MGRPIALDSSIVIYLLERNPQFINKVRSIFRAIRDGKHKAILSIIGLVEILTGPKKRKRFGEAAQYKERLNNFPHLIIGNLNDNIVEIASDLRAKYNLRTPDAIHIATAIDFGAKKFITNDRTLKKIKEIKIESLTTDRRR